MKILKYFLIIFIFLNSPIKADSNEAMISELQKGGKLIFIRHAYAPGGGDPSNFDVNNCETQRNLNDEGRVQSKKIGNFYINLKKEREKEIIINQNKTCKRELIIKFFISFSGTVIFTTFEIIPNECFIISK